MSPALRVLGPLLLLAVPLAAQTATPSEPRLVLSFFGGYRGGGDLWTLNNQPIAVFESDADSIFAVPGQYDTLNLKRRVVPGFIVGASGDYFPKPHVGLHVEITFLDMGTESQCSVRQSQPPAMNDIVPVLCQGLQGQSVPISAVAFSFGLVGRLAPNHTTDPYFLVSGGIISRTRSVIEMSSSYYTANAEPVGTTVVLDTNPSNVGVHVTLGAGVAFSLGPGYQLRFEGRDVITPLQRITGPADPNDQTTGSLTPPRSAQWFHSLAFIVALDVVFEKQRGHRY